jgi:acyl-CoA synthetase (AMP-forming)/AMP-acid ligase II
VIATREGPVFPRAIEDALYRLPSVRRAVVQLSPDNRVVASVVSSVALDPSVIGATLAESLPERARPDVVRQVESLRISPGFRVLPADLAAGALAELRLGSGGYER